MRCVSFVRRESLRVSWRHPLISSMFPRLTRAVRPAAEEAQEIFTVAESLLPQEVARTCHHRAGMPAEEILRFIDVMGIRLVAISGRKHSRVSGLLLGSVMQTVLERAHACVLVAGND